MLQAQRLSYVHHPLFGPVFSNVTFSILPGEKVGLIGANGTGKSTLLDLICGILPVQTGSIVREKRLKVARLPQDFDYSYEGTLKDRVLTASSQFGLLFEKLIQFENRPASATLDEYQEVQQSLQDQGGPAFVAMVQRQMKALGLSEDMWTQRYATLSLGERMRGALAGVLAENPDLLVLDEPTNHLDLEARLWLESALRETRKAVLFVCHDRAMLDGIADRVLELERGTLSEYIGGFTDLIERKRQREDRAWVKFEKDSNELRRLKAAEREAHDRAKSVSKKPKGNNYDPFAKLQQRSDACIRLQRR